MGVLQWIQSRPATGAVINCTAIASVKGAQRRPKFWVSFYVDLYTYLLGVFRCQSPICIASSSKISCSIDCVSVPYPTFFLTKT